MIMIIMIVVTHTLLVEKYTHLTGVEVYSPSGSTKLPSGPIIFDISYTERIIAHQMKIEVSVRLIPGQIL